LSTSRELRVTLPWPPSINGYWRAINRGKYASQIISEDGRRFRSSVALTFKMAPPIAPFKGRLQVEIDLHRGDRRSYDCDNFTKGIFDGLTHAGVWGDDSQVDVLTVRRGAVTPGNPHSVVTIREIEAQP
jgi:crossover junction endodeoxyribonuclease RusA